MAVTAVPAFAVPVTGVVFKDYNDNGARSAEPAFDDGVGGITVTAYAADGSVAGRTTTAADGSYTLDVPQSIGKVRVQFTGLPDGYYSDRVATADPPPPGAKSATTVQFADVGSGQPVTDVNLGILRPSQYCQDNPELIVSCMYYGNASAGNADKGALLAFPRDAGTDPTNADLDALSDPFNRRVGLYSSLGSTYGVAFQRRAGRVFASAFLRHHTSFGPGGVGAIYAVDASTGASSVYADINALFGPGAAGDDPHLPQQACPAADTYVCDNFNDVYGQVHKVGFGALALNEEETRLYAVNLADRRIYELPTDATPTAGNIRRASVPLNLEGCAQEDARPFALTWHEGSLYLGMTCSAESTQDVDDLAAHVYRVDPATLAAEPNPVFSMALGDYERGCFIDHLTPAVPDCRANGAAADWNPWRTAFTPRGTGNNTPQPILADIEFDAGGNMLLGVRDRNGDQLGQWSPPGIEQNANTGAVVGTQGVSSGDLLLACAEGGGWTLEENGACGSRTGVGAGNVQGPGGGEFFGDDDFEVPGGHQQVSLGSVLVLPGYSEAKATTFDPGKNGPAFHQGIRTYALEDGAATRAYILADHATTGFQKANGLGDIEALCDAAPIQIGNYVWIDANRDGIQGPDETPVAGVTVELLDAGGTRIATTTTNDRGQYLFDETNVDGGLEFDADYTVSIPLDQDPLRPYVVTRDNAGSDRAIDSNGVQVGRASQAAVHTGSAGHNDHTYDFGFHRPEEPQSPGSPPPGSPPSSRPEGDTETKVRRPDVRVRKRANRRTVPAGEIVRYRIQVRNRRPGSVARNVRVCDRPPRYLTFVSVPGATMRNGRACWTIRRLAYSRRWRSMSVTARVVGSAPDTTVTNVATAGRRRARAVIRVTARPLPPAPPPTG